MADKIIAIIQARISSARLPGKVLLRLADRSVLEHVVMRVQEAKKISNVVVATSVKKDDEKIEGICKEIGVSVFRGSEEDVLDRFYHAALPLRPDHIVRITADCPMMDPDIIDNIIERHIGSGSDYTCNVIEPTYPDGEDVEVFKMSALEQALGKAKLTSEREHVTPYIRNNPQIFKLLNVRCITDLSKKRWTLDEERDYRFLKIIFDSLYSSNRIFRMDDVLRFLEANPGLEEINSDILRNEGYLKSLRDDENKVVRG